VKGNVTKPETVVFALLSQGSLIMLKIQTRNLENVAVLCLQGRIVNGEMGTLRNAVDSQSHVSAIVLDLAGVSAVDASGLGTMLELRRETESRGIRFKLMNATKSVTRVLEVTHLDSVFEITSRGELWPAISRGRSAGMMKFASCTS
jgi:anti-anti-sigma factor